MTSLGDAPMSKGLHQVFSVAEVLPEKRAGTTLILDSVLPAQPGQFVMAWLPDVEERPFSLMDDDPLSLTVADVGPFTRALCALRAGDRLWIRGPYGHGFDLVGERQLLIAGGSGAASLTLLAKAALSRGHKVAAILGAGTAERLMLVCRFESMGCQVIVATDDGSAGYQGNGLLDMNSMRCMVAVPNRCCPRSFAGPELWRLLAR